MDLGEPRRAIPQGSQQSARRTSELDASLPRFWEGHGFSRAETAIKPERL